MTTYSDAKIQWLTFSPAMAFYLATLLTPVFIVVDQYELL